MHGHGIAKCNNKNAVTHPDGDRLVTAGVIGIQKINELTIDLGIFQIDKFHAVLRGECASDIILGDHAIMDERGKESVGPNIGAGILDLGAGYHSKVP